MGVVPAGCCRCSVAEVWGSVLDSEAEVCADDDEDDDGGGGGGCGGGGVVFFRTSKTKGPHTLTTPGNSVHSPQ